MGRGGERMDPESQAECFPTCFGLPTASLAGRGFLTSQLKNWPQHRRICFDRGATNWTHVVCTARSICSPWSERSSPLIFIRILGNTRREGTRVEWLLQVRGLE